MKMYISFIYNKKLELFSCKKKMCISIHFTLHPPFIAMKMASLIKKLTRSSQCISIHELAQKYILS